MGSARLVDDTSVKPGTDPMQAPAMQSARYAELAVLALTVVLALVELGRIAVLHNVRNLVIAALATAVWLPLHLWHLRYGLRDERPPRSGATLGLIALVQFTALALIGPAWSFMLAALATSSLIVLRWPWSLAMLAVCVVAPVPAVELHRESALTLGSNDAYLMFAVAFRSGLQFALVWLVASIHELAASRAVLAREAADREHARLEASMRAMLERDLVRLGSEARRARAAVEEPGVSAGLVALDRVLAIATAATGELRRVILEAWSAPGVDPAAELARAEIRARTPVGRGLTVRGAWRYFVATNVIVLGFVLIGSVGLLGSDHVGAVAIAPWLVLTVVQVSSLLAVARGVRPRWAYGRFLFVAAVDVAMMRVLGDGWRELGWYIGVAAAVAFSGRMRTVVVAAVFLLAGGYDVWRTLVLSPSAGAGEVAWGFFYTAALAALGTIGVFGSACLIRLLGELDLAREAQVRYVVEAERRRIWGDVHDLLGQTLTAIGLKADLARRMISREPMRSLAELDEVIELAASQAHELGEIARGQREVSFDAEVENAIGLLRAAGIEVSAELHLGELDEPTSRLLGWAVREGTTNILRHACAQRVWIRADRESGAVALRIRNDGVGTQAAAGTGLRGLAGRAAAENGRVSGRVLAGGQFLLEVSVPELVPA